jgi:calcineurin-like phosphoesterase
VIRLRIQDRPVAIFSLMGRTFMRPVDCPFSAADRVLAELQDSGSIIVVDVHAEATADKYLLAHHLNGRVSAVIGTHTHVPTADEQILSEGTAFLCDVGMTGPYASILGRRIDRVMTTSINFVPTAFDVATDDVRLAGVVIEVDESSRRATAIHRVMLRAAEIESNVSG